jgi:hypothetical protein
MTNESFDGEILQLFSDFVKGSIFVKAKDYIDFINNFDLKLDLQTKVHTINQEAINKAVESVSNVVLKYITENVNIMSEECNEFFSELNDYEKHEFSLLVCKQVYNDVVFSLVDQLREMNCEGAGKVFYDENNQQITFVNESFKNN